MVEVDRTAYRSPTSDMLHVRHPIHRRFDAEDIVRLRRSSERRRYAASQRLGRIDANPHQIDAVMFALRRIPEGGCILADEVGLGKTIEAGLVVAQVMAEGTERILIVVPKPLLGQWQDELYTLFGISALEAADAGCEITAPGVFLVGREYAGSASGSERLAAAPPFDLCVIDEAHEMFAGIYRRFDRFGAYDESSGAAQTAHRVRRLIGPAPVLLLTATPMQNSLEELWGLLHYVEPTGTLVGSLPTFKALFCAGQDGRRLVPEQAPELRRRIAEVVQRTLRHQAQEFLDQPFVGRRAKLYEYSMSPEEKQLYDDVTNYLLSPSLNAFQGRSRQLLLIGFHRIMASSTAALANSLERVADRLRRMRQGSPDAERAHLIESLTSDLDDDELPEIEDESVVERSSTIDDELRQVEDFVRRARSLPHDSKAHSLVQVVRSIGGRRGGNAKLVVFTESLTTQEYLRDLLIEHAGLEDSKITLFRGHNDSPRAREALRRWQEEVGRHLPAHRLPSPDIAVRLALVHEFKSRSRVFIATEAGAKGLNLQFCDTIVNYDLPWNPQRIEQRIGRCHRYGQTRDVTVVNFLAKDNEAQRLTLEILTQKLDLFGDVMDMSDSVLHEARSKRSEELTTALGPDFEQQLNRIWERARSIDEVEEELRRLRETMEDRRRELDRIREHTTGLIETRFDDSVKQVFRRIADDLPATLAALDADLERVVTDYLRANGIDHATEVHKRRRLIRIPASERLPGALSEGLSVAAGHADVLEEVDALHVAHPLVRAAIDDARRRGSGTFSVRFRLTAQAPEVLERRRGSRGRLALSRISYRGFEREDRLVATAVFEDSAVLRPAEAALELLGMPCADLPAPLGDLSVTAADLDEVVDEELFFDQAHATDAEAKAFSRALDQLDQYVEDQLLVKRRGQREIADQLKQAEERRDAALGADARSRAEDRIRRLERELSDAEDRIERLASRDDSDYERWRADAHRRRYEPPRAARLFDLEFVIA